MSLSVDVAIIGAGSAGLAALNQVRRAGRSFALIDGGELGTTCARVGCMPSKALLQVAEDFARRKQFARIGIDGGEDLSVDHEEAMEHVRDLRDIFVDRVLAGTIDELGDQFIAAPAKLLAPDTIQAGDQIIKAGSCVLAVGSRPHVPDEWAPHLSSLTTTDDIFELETLPARLAVIGLGAIGLEMGQALARLGVETVGFERLAMIGGLSDPAVNAVALETLRRDFPIHVEADVSLAEAPGGISVKHGEELTEVDRVLVCAGRRSNVDRLGLDALGIPFDQRGLPEYDPSTMQIADTRLFIAGDVVPERPVLHEAVDEGTIAGYNAAREDITGFQRREQLTITFCDPNLVTVGGGARMLENPDYVVGEVRFGPVGRALLMGKNRGLLRVYLDKASLRLSGAEMCGPRCEHLGHLVAWSIQEQRTALELLQMPYYHPAIEEALQAALRDALGKLEGGRDSIAELRRV